MVGRVSCSLDSCWVSLSVCLFGIFPQCYNSSCHHLGGWSLLAAVFGSGSWETGETVQSGSWVSVGIDEI